MTKENLTKKLFRSNVFIGLGLTLLLGAAGLCSYNQWLNYRAGQESSVTVTALVEEMPYGAEIIRHIPELDEMTPVSEVAVPPAEPDSTSSASYMGILTIPRLERLLPVQSSWSLPQLKHAPCRYSGSLTDGQLVIAAHNYKTHFGGLGTLSQGDSVIFTALDGSQVLYEVAEICTLEATDIAGMINSGYDLSLFTCSYGGKARVTVRCMEKPQ